MARVQVPKETKPYEGRVALAPPEAKYLIEKGHTLEIETTAGAASGYPDDAYRDIGASVVPRNVIWRGGGVITKVKELQKTPGNDEFALVQPDSTILLFAHYAGDPRQKEFFDKARHRDIFAVPYEELLINGRSPVLTEMSRCAGEIAAYIGCEYLRTDHGGPGILPSDAVAQILGMGDVGSRAMEVLEPCVKEIHAHDIAFRETYDAPHVYLHESTPEIIMEFLKRANFTICAAFSRMGTPILITEEMLASMPPHTLIIDVAIDEGGNCALSSPGTPDNPIVQCASDGRAIYAVPNMPGMVPRSSTPRLSKAVLPFVESACALLDRSIRPTSARSIIHEMTKPLKKNICF